MSEEMQKNPKKISLKIWGILAVVAVVLVVLLCNFKVVANGVSKLVLSPEKYYAQVEEKELKELVANLASVYDNAVLSHSDVTNQSVDYNMELELGEEAYNMLASALEIEDGESLSKMGIALVASVKNDVISAEVAAKLGKDKLISANGVLDVEAAQAYGQIPELSEMYIGADISDVAETLQESMTQSAEMMKLFPKKALVEKLLNRYIAIALENVDSVNEKEDTISVGELEQKCTSIRVRLKARDAVNMLQAICEEAKDDEELIDLAATFVANMQEMEEAEAKETVSAAIVEVLDNIESIKDSADEDAEVIMYVFVNNKGEVIGREITVNKDEFVISYEMPQKGKNFALEAKMGDEYTTVVLTGTGEKSSSSLSGEFELEMRGMKLLGITVEELNTKKTKQGLPTGSFTLKPTSSFYSMLGMGSMASLLLSYEIDVEMETSKSDADVALSLMNQENMFAKLSMDAKTGSGKSASLPKKGILVEGEDDLAEWVQSMDFEKFIKKLAKTDLPKEFVIMLEDAMDDIDDMMSSY